MTFKQLCYLIKTDYYRYAGRVSKIGVIRSLISHAEFKYAFWFRVCAWCKDGKILRYTIFQITKHLLTHYQFKYGILISCNTKIGAGLSIVHFGGIVINTNTVIGKNLTVQHGVGIGWAPRGKRKGTATIGDNVFIGPGAKIVGRVSIGNNVAIGANAVVVDDVPDNAVVAGIPAKIISYNGSEGYVNRIDYENIIPEIKD